MNGDMIKEKTESIWSFRNLIVPVLIREGIIRSNSLISVEKIVGDRLSNTIDCIGHVDYFVVENGKLIAVWVRNRYTGDYLSFTLRELTELKMLTEVIKQRSYTYPAIMIQSNITQRGPNGIVTDIGMGKTVNVIEAVNKTISDGSFSKLRHLNRSDNPPTPFINIDWKDIEGMYVWSNLKYKNDKLMEGVWTI